MCIVFDAKIFIVSINIETTMTIIINDPRIFELAYSRAREFIVLGEIVYDEVIFHKHWRFFAKTVRNR